MWSPLFYHKRLDKNEGTQSNTLSSTCFKLGKSCKSYSPDGEWREREARERLVSGAEIVSRGVDTGFSVEILGIITSLALGKAHLLYSSFFRSDLCWGELQMLRSPKEQKYQTGQDRCATFHSVGLLKESRGSLALLTVVNHVVKDLSVK